MNCEQSTQHLDDLLAGELTDETRSAFETHLADCPACRQQWEILTHLSRELRALPHEEPAPSLRRKFYSTFDAYRAGLQANPDQPDTAAPSRGKVRATSLHLPGRNLSSPLPPALQGVIQGLWEMVRPYRFQCGGLATVAALIFLFTLATPSTTEPQMVAQTSGSPQEQMLAWQANRRWFAELLGPAPAPAPERKPAVPPRPRSDRATEERRT